MGRQDEKIQSLSIDELEKEIRTIHASTSKDSIYTKVGEASLEVTMEEEDQSSARTGDYAHGAC